MLAGWMAGCGAAKQRQEQPAYPEREGSAQTKESWSEQAPSSPAPADAAAGAEATQPGGGYPAATAPPGAYPPAPPTQPRYATPPPTMGSLGETAPIGDRAHAVLEDFLVAEAALMASGASCFDACRALRSMQRAAAKLCEMASSGSEHQRCDAAESRYRAARERVRGACGQCAGGPSLEPNAPLEDDR